MIPSGGALEIVAGYGVGSDPANGRIDTV